jgi:hypothetical protein
MLFLEKLIWLVVAAWLVAIYFAVADRVVNPPKCALIGEVIKLAGDCN